jgi:hypothetical protein
VGLRRIQGRYGGGGANIKNVLAEVFLYFEAPSSIQKSSFFFFIKFDINQQYSPTTLVFHSFNPFNPLVSAAHHRPPLSFTMKNMQALITALALATTATATAIQDVWGGHDWNETISYTTFTTDIFTTFCPSPTKVTIGTKTYTVTTSQTLTVTDCP